MKRFIGLLLTFLIIMTTISCDKDSDMQNGSIPNEEDAYIYDVEISNDIFEKIKIVMSQFDYLTRAAKTYSDMEEDVEYLFSDIAAIAHFKEIIGGLSIWSKADNELVLANEINNENVAHYESVIIDAIVNGERWYFTKYEISDLIFDGEKVKVIAKLTMQTGDDFYFRFIFDFEDSEASIIDFTSIDYDRYKSQFEEFKFIEKVLFSVLENE